MYFTVVSVYNSRGTLISECCCCCCGFASAIRSLWLVHEAEAEARVVPTIGCTGSLGKLHTPVSLESASPLQPRRQPGCSSTDDISAVS